MTIPFTLLTTIAFADSAGCPKYDRKIYRHWIDEDRDCQNARHEVLIEESLSTLGASLQIAAEWSQEAGMARILAEPLLMATKLDLDHMVSPRRPTRLVLPIGQGAQRAMLMIWMIQTRR